MALLLHKLTDDSAQRPPDVPALPHKQDTWSYRRLKGEVARVAAIGNRCFIDRHDAMIKTFSILIGPGEFVRSSLRRQPAHRFFFEGDSAQ
jgi:hypothetical protein